MRALLASLCVVFLAGCVAYNDQCQPLVDNPQEQIAFIKNELWLDKPNARHADNAIGQQSADAYVWVFKDSGAPAQFAVVNGGAIRAEGLCVTRNILPVGPLTNGVLHEILLFQNLVDAVDLSEQEVWDMFERSAQPLYASPTTIAAPSGSFLQVSKEVHVEIDCSKTPLSRVTAISVGGVALQKPARPLSQVKFRVALPEFLLGGDGYTMLAGKGTDTTRNPSQAQRFGGIDSNIAAAYLKQSAFNVSQEAGLTVDNSRVVLNNCSLPGRPQ
jgi:2',3'-cyclic-nucleotide 2'-phosphodiesterase (5'-nucleotidase family)